MNIILDKKKWKSSPITEHSCFLGEGCDLWHRKNGVTFTCGLTNFLPINLYLSKKNKKGDENVVKI